MSIFTLFQTKKNISIKEASDLKCDIGNKVSVLNEYRSEILFYMNKNKIDDDDKNNIILKKVSDDYWDTDLINDTNIDKFSKNFIYIKDQIVKSNTYIDSFIELDKKINIKVINKYNNNLTFNNPINIKKINYGLIDTEYFDKFNINYNNNFEEINKSLAILLQGDLINLSLPSVGIISTEYIKLLKMPVYTYIDFIKEIINHDIINNEKLINFPLKKINFSETLANILLNKSSENINNNNKINILLRSMIDNINIDLKKEIFTDVKDTKKINIKYIIPYKEETDSAGKPEIKYSKKFDLSKIDDIIKHNITIIKKINDDIENSGGIEEISEIKKKNYIKVFACFLFYIIELTYDICKKYLNKADDIIKNLLDVREKRFKDLNLIEAFDYIKLLNKSLLKFKTIQLNNFYYLFKPSNINAGSYGMKRDENNYYNVDENTIFLNSIEEIYKYYPFDKITSININHSNNLDIFLTNINEKSDIYDNNDILEFGGYSFNSNIMNTSYKILKEYYNIFKKINNYSLLVINKIYNNFENYKMPCELIDIFPLHANNAILERNFLNRYENYMEKTTEYLKKIVIVNKKIKNSTKIDISNLYNQKQIFLLNIKIYYFKILAIKKNTETLSNIRIKILLLKKYKEINDKYRINNK